MPRIPTMEFLPFRVLMIVNTMQTAMPDSDWRRKSEAELWSHAVQGILSSQSKWETVVSKMQKVVTSGLLEELRNRPSASVERKVRVILAKEPHLRFANRKSRFLREASKRLYHDPNGPGSLRGLLEGAKNEAEARRNLINYISGMGMKQASHFLSCIGYAKNLAIVDRHIQRFLSKRCGKALRKTKYVHYENEFREMARRHSVSVAALDHGVWVYMREL